MRKRKWERILILISFTVPFAVYLRTLSPSVNFGDTGELITAAYTLGIPHPPGFPIWCLLAKIFTFLPIRTIAWRVNLSSAVFSAAAVSVIFLISKTILALLVPAEQSGKRNKVLILLPALAASLIFAFTKVFWSGAVYAEVYSLNTLFSALILFWTLRWFEKREDKYLCLLAFTYGLSLTNHYLILLLAPPLVLWFILCERELLKNRKLLISMLVSLLLGISFFLYLPIRSRANPPIDWGNPETLESALAHVGRKQFARAGQSSVGIVNLPIASFSSGLDLVYRGLSTFWIFLTILSQTFSPLLIIIGLAGGIFLLVENRRLFLLLFFLFLTAGWGYIFARYTRTSPEGFFLPCIPAFLFFVPFLAAGFFLILKKLPALLFPALLALPLVPLYQNFDANDWSQNFTAQDHANNILKTVDDGALIFAEENEWIFPILYLRVVEGKRPDVTIYDRNGNLFADIYQEAKKEYITEENFESRRRKIEEELIRESSRPAYYAVDKRFENYRYENIEMEGILYKQGETKKLDFAKEYQNILAIEDKEFRDVRGSDYIIAYYHLRFGDILQQSGRTEEAKEEYEEALRWGKNDSRILNNLAVTYVNLGEGEKAEEILKEALKVNPKSAIAHNNLGTIYEEMGKAEKAKDEYKKALELNSRYPAAIVNLSSLYEAEGDYKKALEGYQLALSLKPTDEEIKKKIVVLSRMTRTDEARRWFEEGLSLAKEEDYAAAIEKYEKAISLSPSYPEAYNNIGVCHARLGSFDKAREFWEKALAIDPQNKEAKENLKLLESLKDGIL